MARTPEKRRSRKVVKPPVIDLDAEVVETGENPETRAEADRKPAEMAGTGKADGDKTEAARAEDGKAGKDADKPAKEAGAPKSGAGKPDPKAATPQPPPLEESEALAGSRSPGGTGSPPQTRGSNKGWIAGAIAASLVAALLAGALIHRAISSGNVAELGREVAELRAVSDKRAETIETLTSELAKLKQAADNAGTPDGASGKALEDRFAEIDKRIGKAETASADLRSQVSELAAARPGPAPAGADVKALTRRMDNLSKSLLQMSAQIEAVRTAGAGSNGTPVGDGTAATPVGNGDLAALKKQVETLARSVGEAAADLEGLKKNVVSLSLAGSNVGALNKQINANAEKLAALTSEINALSALKPQVDKLAALPAEVAKLAETPAAPGVPPVGSAYAELSRKIAGGEAFSAELDKLVAVYPDAPGIGALRPLSNDGVVPAKKLLAELAAINEALSPKNAVEAADKDGGVLSGLTARLLANVKIRKAGESDWPALTAKAVSSGSLTTAYDVLASGNAPPDTIAGWMARADRRLKADSAERELSRAVVARLADSDGT